MPNQPLLDKLDSLRETYTQQSKATSTLQTALKSVIDAQTKAQKVLRDFGAHGVGVEIAEVQEALAQSRLRDDIDPLLPDLRRKLKELTPLLTSLKDAAASLRSEPVDVVRLDKAITHLQTARQEEVAALIPTLSEELDVAQRGLADEFGQRLRDALADQGVQIGGRAPKFEIGRFELDANFARRSITLLYGKDVVAPRLPITIDAAIKAYNAATKAVMGRAGTQNQDGKAWIAQFYEAYQIAKRKRMASGPRINIVDCYVEMSLLRQSRAFAGEPSKRTFTDYMRAQFAYDFYEFTDRQRLSYEGQVVRAHSATKSQTDSPTKSFWIVEGDTPYDGRYVADIEFVMRDA